MGERLRKRTGSLLIDIEAEALVAEAVRLRDELAHSFAGQPGEQAVELSDELDKLRDNEGKAHSLDRRFELLRVKEEYELRLARGWSEPRLRLELSRHLAAPETRLPPEMRERAAVVLAAQEPDNPALPQAQDLVLAAIRERYAQQREKADASLYQVNFLIWLTIILIALLFATVITVGFVSSREAAGNLILAGVAGALGGTLSGVLRLRSANRADLRAQRIGTAILLQPLVGAAAGIAVYFLWTAGLFTIANLDSTKVGPIAAIGFVAGFSEPFLLSIVSRIAGPQPP
ncbi:hypothetical protein OJ998_16070 [Solirubrobacter taibaiensis]|nr:hypothetical protein [Solirubrobacter taibaiensis]